MSEYGTRILNFQSASIYEYNHGFRNYMDYKSAMLTNSLFSDFLKENGMNITSGGSTRDIVCLEFGYGSKSFQRKAQDAQNKITALKKEIKKCKQDGDLEKANQLNGNVKKLRGEKERCLEQSKLFDVSKQALRTMYYNDGVDIHYKARNGKECSDGEVIHYRMLYRTPGKAKKGTVMFIRESLYVKALDFLRMGIELPEQNTPIVEIGAYSSLSASAIVGKIKIEPENILILKDVDSFMQTKVISIETDERKHCLAKEIDGYRLNNTMFDGQALIDSSLFPKWADGYILLRHHFCKMAAFNTNIQVFFRDYFGGGYENAELEDMFGNKHLARDVKLITTENAMKWLKFPVGYEYWCSRVWQNGAMFGIVKTAHGSKLGNVQQMSYQMVNALDIDTIGEVVKPTLEYIEKLKNDDEIFLKYLSDNANFTSDYDVLVDLVKQDRDFIQSKYFKKRREDIIYNYINRMKLGKLIQNADNLTIVGSPYAMLLHSVGANVEEDDTFSHEDGTIQCYTGRFADGEYLAGFRSPFNSRNNLNILHNTYSGKIDRYFNFGKLILAVNMLHTDFQDRNNGSDQDSDSLYVTNEPYIVSHARHCYQNYPTIVNNIPKESRRYGNSMDNFAQIDNQLAAAQRAIGESSNLAQIALTYTYAQPDNEDYRNYVCILAVIAQVAIDSAKRAFDIDILAEIQSIKKAMGIGEADGGLGYPLFWKRIKEKNDAKQLSVKQRSAKKEKEIKEKSHIDELAKKKKEGMVLTEAEEREITEYYEKERIFNADLKCPMGMVDGINIGRKSLNTKTYGMDVFFKKFDVPPNRRACAKVETLINKYSIRVYENGVNYDEENLLLLRDDFDSLVRDIRSIYISNNYKFLMSWLLNRAFMITSHIKSNKKAASSKIRYRKPILMKVLYTVNKDVFLECFSNNVCENLHKKEKPTRTKSQ